jgi:hypothetical protein
VCLEVETAHHCRLDRLARRSSASRGRGSDIAQPPIRPMAHSLPDATTRYATGHCCFGGSPAGAGWADASSPCPSASPRHVARRGSCQVKGDSGSYWQVGCVAMGWLCPRGDLDTNHTPLAQRPSWVDPSCRCNATACWATVARNPSSVRTAPMLVGEPRPRPSVCASRPSASRRPSSEDRVPISRHRQ